MRKNNQVSNELEDQMMLEADNKSQIQLPKILFVIALGLVVFLLGMSAYLFNQNQVLTNELADSKNETQKQKSEELSGDQDAIDKKQIDYFKENVLPQYPEIQSEVEVGEISNLYPLTLGKNKEDSRAWLVEVVADKQLSHYLISSLVQKKLEKSVSAPYVYGDNRCSLGEVVTVGNERGLQRELRESQGYLILSSINCSTRGVVDSTSIYSLGTGEKIIISGDNFNILGTTLKGISESGNALGRLRGVYGINKPIVTVEYGSFGPSSANKIEDVSLIAYFDLQTGKLIKTEVFD